jgi:hypothetical protein
MRYIITADFVMTNSLVKEHKSRKYIMSHQVILVKFIHFLNIGFQFLITSFHLLDCLYEIWINTLKMGRVIWFKNQYFGVKLASEYLPLLICFDKIK